MRMSSLRKITRQLYPTTVEISMRSGAEGSRIGASLRGSTEAWNERMALATTDLRDQLRSEIQAVGPAELLPHHRRGALIIARPDLDILDAAEAIASDDASRVAQLLSSGQLYRPALGELASWCVDSAMRLQFVILQPYVLAQAILAVDRSST